MVAVLLAVTGGAGYLGAAVVARHQAQSAADLAALAAAARVPAGAESACNQAGAVARAMRAHTAACAVDDVAMPDSRWGNARATARAGPA
jgi:secretion/DNA translocation related TadE-like protein